MRKRFKQTSIFVVVILIFIFAVYWFIFKSFDLDMKPLIEYKKVVFEDLNETLYLRAMAWGIAGNHNEIIISQCPIVPIDRKSIDDCDFIFYTTDIYYKKQGNDTLLVYVEGSSVGRNPKKYNGDVDIVIVQLTTYKDIKEYVKCYDRYGLTKLSVYSENK